MKEVTLRRLFRDMLWLVMMTLATAVLVIQLGTHSASLMPALAVLAFMTPMVASAAVQLHRDLRQADRHGGVNA